MGVIKNGKYYPSNPKRRDGRDHVVSNIASNGNLQQSIAKHAHEIIQPNLPDGSPNPDFIDYYPREAKEYGFIPENNEKEN